MLFPDVQPKNGEQYVDNAVHQLVRTFGLLERVMQPYFARFGISGSQWGVLRALHRAAAAGSPALRLTDLSDRLLIRPPSVTALVDRLERQGLVSRQADEGDMRVKQVALTDRGRKLVREILNVHGDQIRLVLGGIPAEEHAELLRLLRGVERHLKHLLEEGPASAHTGSER